MDEDSKQARMSNGFDGGVLPEVEAYAFLLVVTYLIDTDKIELVSFHLHDPHAPCVRSTFRCWLQLVCKDIPRWE